MESGDTDPTPDAEGCATTDSFDDHGIESGTTLIQRAYYTGRRNF